VGYFGTALYSTKRVKSSACVTIVGMGDPPSPEQQTTWTALKRFYQRGLSPVMAVGVLLWLSCVLILKPPRPPIGTYIACLACLAVVVTIWPPESTWSKAAWLVVFFACTGLEIAILYQERAENQKQQAETRRDEKDAFKAIADGLRESMSKNQDAFDTALGKMQRLDVLSHENINEVTGGNGFVTIEPSIYPVDKDGMSLTAIVHGKYVIRGVGYTLNEGAPIDPNNREQRDAYINEFMAGRSNRLVNVGDMTPKSVLVLGRVLKPSLTDIVHYNVTISALNGPINESLDVKYDSVRHQWNEKVTISRRDDVVWKHDWLWPIN
jgi:hypothetical protein